MASDRSRSAVRAWAAGVILFTSLVTVFVSGIAADTSSNPDTVTKADWDPAPVDASNGKNAGSTLTGAFEGRVLKVYVEGPPGQFFSAKARLCRPGLDIQFQSQMSPTQSGDCIAAPFESGKDDDFVAASAGENSPPNKFVAFNFRVGQGTESSHPGPGQPITCGPGNPCALWIHEQVDQTMTADQSGDVFKHFDITYDSTGTTTTTTPSTTTTTTTTTASSTTTAPSTTTSTPTSTTTAPSTTTTTPTSTTTTTAAPGSSTTTSTTTTPSTTTTTAATGSSTTSTTGATSSTTSTSQPAGGSSSTTTTSASGGTVSPSSSTPGGTFSVTSSGWQGTVTVTFRSDPVVLGALSANSAGVVSGQFAVPRGATAGLHTVELAGTSTSGSPRTVSIPFSVVAASASGALPRTGMAALRLVLVALMLCGGGLVLVQLGARRRGAHYRS